MTGDFIYLLRPIGMLGPIKIGCSHLPVNRLKSLACWSPFPLEIIVSVPGTAELERNLHECFAASHSHLEWFHATPILLDFVQKLQAGVPVEQAVDLENRVGSIRRGLRVYTEADRARRSAQSKIYWAIRRYEQANKTRICTPHDVDGIMREAYGRMQTEAEQARISDFVRDPAKHGLTIRQKWPPKLPVASEAS